MHARLRLALLAAGFAAAAAGCRPDRTALEPLPVLPMADAIDRVNANHARLVGTAQARGGHARGHFTDTDGARRSFDLDAKLLVHPPRCLRLDLKALLESQLVFGSNPEKYWVVQPNVKALTYGRHSRDVIPDADDLIIRPDLLVEALGLNLLPEQTIGDAGPVQRIVGDHQQLIFLAYDESLQGYIAKEYWLSRHEPRLVDRIVFRDPEGKLVMASELSRYRPVGDDGLLLPHRVEITWPATDGRMLFTASGWKILPQVDESHPGFAFPLDRGATFDRIVDVDVELDAIHHPLSEREKLERLLNSAVTEP